MNKVFLGLLIWGHASLVFASNAIVKMHYPLKGESLSQSFAQDFEIKGVESVEKLPLVENTYEIKFKDATLLKRGLETLAQKQNVLYSYESKTFHPMIQNAIKTTGLKDNPNPLPVPDLPTPRLKDPKRGANWNIPFNGVYDAWKYSKGAGVVVAVIDTGIDYNHEDLINNVWRNPGETGTDILGLDKSTNGIDDDGNGFVDDFMGWDFVQNDNRPFDTYAHGSHVAGIIAAVEGNGVGGVGVAPEAKILPIRFIGDGMGSDADAIKSLAYAVSMGVDIINNSWGGREPSPALEEAFRNLENSGILIVNAAGNDGADLGASSAFPAKYKLKNTITVAANGKENQIIYFSNHSTIFVQMSAAGHEVNSSVPGNDYASYSGTSMAAPQVAAEAALILALRPSLTPERVKSLMRAKDAGQPTRFINNPTYGLYTRFTEWRRYSHPGFSLKWLSKNTDYQ